ncbi:uncharacterized protein LOC106358973 [Brassica napus]|nr:uncharacterized protein LOC106358973 [Brassica napus]
MSSLRLKLEMISNWGVGGAFILLFHTVVNPDPISPLIAEYVPFSGDKRYATTQGVFRGSTVSHGFVSKPYALHEKIPWWRRCLYLTSGSLRSLYSTQELDGVSVALIIQGLDAAVVGGGEKKGMDGKLVGREGIVVGNEGKVGIENGEVEVGIVGRVGCGNVDGNGGIEVGMVGRVGCGNVDGNGGIEVGMVGRVGCGMVDGNGGSPVVGIGMFGI